ncbi:hypothetical protein ACO1NJ_14255, partial [Staphylococcus aureus]
MSDSRIEKMAALSTGQAPDLMNSVYSQTIAAVEEAGLLVVDPSDPAVIDRIAEALALLDHPTAVKAARAVLAALGG